MVRSGCRVMVCSGERALVRVPAWVADARGLPDLHPRIHIKGEFGERADADAGRSLGLVWFRLLRPRGACNVHMDPWQISGKLLEEYRRADRAAGTTARVGEIGDLALEKFLVIVEERHRPAAVSSAFARTPHFLHPCDRPAE